MKSNRNVSLLVTIVGTFLFSATALGGISQDKQSQDIVSVEQFSKNKYVVEVRRIGADGWPDLVQSLVLDSKKASDRVEIRRFLSLSGLGSGAHGIAAQNLHSSSPIPLWQATNAWSEAWEQRYADWVAQEVDKTFYQRNNIATDCADIVYAARWIFSRIHGLPAAFELAGTNTVLTHLSVRGSWAQLPSDPEWNKDARFLASLNYLLDQTNTFSLRSAGYPIAINANTLKPGVYRVRTNWGGRTRHTYFFHRFNPDPSSEYPILNLQSDVPRVVRVVNEAVFEPRELRGTNVEGFQRIRWAVLNGTNVSILSPSAHSYFSEEQFDDSRFPPDQWAMKILQAVNPHFSMDWMRGVVTRTLIQNLVNRAQVVEEGYAHCQNHDCSEGTASYENWSTPARDQKLLDYYDTYRRYADWDEFSRSVVRILGQDYPARFIYDFFVEVGGSPDPRLSPEERWGFFPDPFANKIEAFLKSYIDRRSLCLKDPGCDIWRIDDDAQYRFREFHIPYVSYSFNASVRAILNGVLRLTSTKRLLYSGIDRSLRQWIAFSSAACQDSPLRELDPWGQALGSDWKVGAYGERVRAVDPKNQMTLTESFLINERTHEVIEVNGSASALWHNSENQLVSIGNTLYQWESGFKADCKDGWRVDLMENDRFFLCGNRIWEITPQGFQVFKEDFDSAWTVGSGARAGVLILHSNGTEFGRLFLPDGSELKVDSYDQIDDARMSKSYLILTRKIDDTTRHSFIDLKTSLETFIDPLFPGSDPGSLRWFFSDSSDATLVGDDASRLWKLDLSSSTLVPRLLASRIDPRDVRDFESPRQVKEHTYGLSFLMQDDPATSEFDEKYFNVAFVGDQIQELPVTDSYVRYAIPTQDGMYFCSGETTYRLGAGGSRIVDSQSCTLPTRTSILSFPAIGVMTKKSIAGEPISDLRPEMDFIEPWNHDYIPRYRKDHRAYGSIWYNVREIF